MHDTKLTSLIETITNANFFPETDFISKPDINPGCQQCAQNQQLLLTISQRLKEVTNSFNLLLENSQDLVKGFMNVIQQANFDFLQMAKQLQEEKRLGKQEVQEEKRAQCELENSIRSLELLLLEKGQEIAESRDELEQNESFIEKIKIQAQEIRNESIQQLKQIENEKSLASSILIKKLEQKIADLLELNSVTTKKNQQLSSQVFMLSENIQILEKNLADAQIKGKMIQTVTQGESSKKSQLSSVLSQQSPSNYMSFAGQSFPLKDVLNISQESSNVLFLTKKKTIQDENDQNMMNRQSSKEIKAISEFEVSEKHQKKKQEKSVDPYYSFFLLTIQCIKMNWHDINEVANIKLQGQWKNLIGKNIPMNKWQLYLEKKIRNLVQ